MSEPAKTTAKPKTKSKKKPKITGAELVKIRQEEQALVNAQAAEDAADKPDRPGKYTTAIVDEFCLRIALGNSLRTVCRDNDMPTARTIFRWLNAVKADGSPKYSRLCQQYTRACEERSEAFAEDILDIADDGTNDWMEIHRGNSRSWVVNGEAIGRSKLRVETRMALMAKLKPKKYGNRVEIDGLENMPAPLIYIPRELGYAIAEQAKNRGVIDATSSDKPAATTESETPTT